jgi:Mevalonate 5-diphosphate decarboxylase C-terminal domain
MLVNFLATEFVSFQIKKLYSQVAYTFDAGPNACLYLLEQDVPTVAALVKLIYPPNPEQQQDFFRGIPVAPSVILPPVRNIPVLT